VLRARLQALVSRMTQVIDDQRGGMIDTRPARVRKEELRRRVGKAREAGTPEPAPRSTEGGTQQSGPQGGTPAGGGDVRPAA
jgi:hypothetical protein